MAQSISPSTLDIEQVLKQHQQENEALRQKLQKQNLEIQELTKQIGQQLGEENRG